MELPRSLMPVSRHLDLCYMLYGETNVCAGIGIFCDEYWITHYYLAQRLLSALYVILMLAVDSFFPGPKHYAP